ncbi:MAG: ATP-binding protein [Bacteroidota bacterium]
MYRHLQRRVALFNTHLLHRYPEPGVAYRRSILLLQIALAGTGPGIILMPIYIFSGIAAGYCLFGLHLLLLPVWLYLVWEFPHKQARTAHLFVLTTLFSFQYAIFFSNGLQSPFFNWQVLTPLAGILLLSWSGLRIWGTIGLAAMLMWYIFDLPSSDVMLPDPSFRVHLLSNLMLFLVLLISLVLLIANQRQIFRSKARMEAEMHHNQALLGDIVAGQLEARSRLRYTVAEELQGPLTHLRDLQTDFLKDAQLSPQDVALLQLRLRDLQTEVDRIVHDLAEHPLDKTGLQTAVQNLCQHLEHAAEVQLFVDFPSQPKLPMDTRNLHLYRILQEAFHNIIRHAQATEVRLAVRIESAQIMSILIEDNGVGLPVGAVRRGASGQGLQNIADRVELLGGELVLGPRPGGGLRIQISLPHSLYRRLKLPFQ